MAEVEIPQPEEMHEKAEKPFTRNVALCVALYAVGLAITSFGGHNAAKEMMMAKQNEANAWNRYQSKSTREALYRNEIWKLEAESKMPNFPEAKKSLLEMYKVEEERMKSDKKAIEQGEPGKHGALDYQKEVELNQRKDPYFDLGEVAFQIAIVLASVAMISEKRWAFALSLFLAFIAILLTINGFGLWVAVPGLDSGPAAGH